jgi:hypothetical protein
MPHNRNLAAPATWHTMDQRGGLCDSPDENVLLFEDEAIGLQCCFVEGAQGDAVSSRWSSNRCSDYAVTNAVHHVQHVRYDIEAISDHKTFCCSFQLPSQPRLAPLFRLARHGNLSKPKSCSFEDCQGLLRVFVCKLNTAGANPLHDARTNPSHKNGRIKFSIGLPTVQGKLDHATDTFRIRHLRNLLAKLCECQNFETHGRQGCFEQKCLF